MVEYTSSMYVSVLDQPIENVTAEHIFNTTQQMYRDNYNLTIFDHWGFNNTYAIVVREDTAEKYQLKTISDFAKVSDDLVFSPTIEFSNREDGIIGLQKAYGMNFKEIIPMDGGLRYTAIDNNECDAMVAYTTDSLGSKYDLVTLEDDKEFFLAYHAVPIVRQETLDEYPEIADAVTILSGKLTEEIMAELNYQVEVDGKRPEDVAKTFLSEQGYI